jgi:hypothetical protein
LEHRRASARRRDRDLVRGCRNPDRGRQRRVPAVGCSPGAVLCQSDRHAAGIGEPPRVSNHAILNSTGANSAVVAFGKNAGQGDRYGARARGAGRKNASGYLRTPQRSDRRSDRDVDGAVLDCLRRLVRADHCGAAGFVGIRLRSTALVRSDRRADQRRNPEIRSRPQAAGNRTPFRSALERACGDDRAADPVTHTVAGADHDFGGRRYFGNRPVAISRISVYGSRERTCARGEDDAS